MAQESLSESVAGCDQEPIHVLGLIQPHGALLCLDGAGRLVARSANAADLLGELPEPGRPLDTVHLCGRARAAIAAALQGDAAALDSIEVDGPGETRFELVMHWSAGQLMAEFEAIDPRSAPASQFALYAQRAIQQLQAAQYADDAQLLQAASRAIAAMTGFDRVMAYRFLPDGSGEVASEARRPDLPSYLHQRYPAGDIPAQARRLYVLNPIRQIASVADEPVPIVPARNPAAGGLYDLSQAVLRSVSPIHIEYLRNMGVGASMSVSIVVDGRLWGLFACHHMAPRRVSHALRLSCIVLAQIVAILLGQLALRRRIAEEKRVDTARKAIAAELAKADDPMAGLAAAQDRIRSLIDCEGVVAVVDRQVACLGPGVRVDIDAALGLAEHMAATGRDLLVTDGWQDELPAIAPPMLQGGPAVGCLALQVLGDARITIVWLRAEFVQTINWAGPVDKVVASGPHGARLTPRGSFEVWKQVVRGHSRQWTELDREASRELKTILQDVALQRMLEVERARTTLLAMLGHDLRNPLHAIGMAMQLMGRGMANSTDTVRRVEGSTQRMQSLINYILDVSSIRAGLGLSLARRPTPLAELMEATLEQNRLALPGAVIEADVAPDLGQAEVDPDRLGQALTNLISNASHHGDTRYPVVVRARREGAATVLEVVNRLREKPPARFAQLLDPFKTSSVNKPTNRGGLGLGLYIASAIVRGHGSSLEGEFTDTEARIRFVL